MGDVGFHWTQTDAVDALIFGASTAPVAAYLGDTLDDPSAATLDGRGVACVLAPPSAVRSDDTTAAPGCYTMDDSTVKVLVTDEEVAAGAHLGAEAFYDALFDRLEGEPVVVMFRIGPDGSNSTIDVQHTLDWIADAPWLVTEDLAGLSRRSDAAPATLTGADGESDPKYWADVAESRASTLAYVEAVGSQDPDAALALRAVLAAESSLLAGGDESSQAEGLARAGEALGYVTAQFALVRLDATDVTLSGSTGDVPLTLINDTGRPMTLTLDAGSSTANSTVTSQEIVAQPTQTFLTLPVDLGNSLADELLVTVRAGDVTVTEASVRVRASYIDRLATVLMVVIVLAVLLVIIRRRVSRPVADTIVDDPERHRRAAGDE